MTEYIWRNYLVEFTKYGKRRVESLTYLDVVGEPERRIGDAVTVVVNNQKRLGIVLGIG